MYAGVIPSFCDCGLSALEPPVSPAADSVARPRCCTSFATPAGMPLKGASHDRYALSLFCAALIDEGTQDDSFADIEVSPAFLRDLLPALVGLVHVLLPGIATLERNAGPAGVIAELGGQWFGPRAPQSAWSVLGTSVVKEKGAVASRPYARVHRGCLNGGKRFLAHRTAQRWTLSRCNRTRTYHQITAEDIVWSVVHITGGGGLRTRPLPPTRPPPDGPLVATTRAHEKRRQRITAKRVVRSSAGESAISPPPPFGGIRVAYPQSIQSMKLDPNPVVKSSILGTIHTAPP